MAWALIGAMTQTSTNPMVLTERQLLDTRLHSLGLATPPPGSGREEAVEHVKRMLAVQGQDLPGTMWAIASRTETATRTEVEDLFNSGELVRSWPFRGTLHVMAPSNGHFIMRVMGPRLTKSTTNMRLGWGLTDSVVARAKDIVIDRLHDGGALSRAELLELWNAQGLPISADQAYRLILSLALSGDLLWGPMQGKEQGLTVSPWVRTPELYEPVSQDQALDSIVRGVIAGRGPLTLEDISYWTKLGKGILSKSLQRIESQIEACTLDKDPQNRTYYALKGAVESAAEANFHTVLLNPGFDEFLLGYRERGPQLHEGGIDMVVPGRNGVFKPTVALRGKVIGTWSKKDRARDSVIQVKLFAHVKKTAVLEKELARQSRRYEAFHGRPTVIDFVTD